MTFHHDPGVQPERTSLSWTRTLLALGVCAATILRWSTQRPMSAYILVVVMILLMIIGGSTQRRRYETDATNLAHEHAEPNTFGVVLSTCALVIIAVTELVMILL